MKKQLLTAATLSLMFGASQHINAQGLDAYVGVASDYVFRGISQTQEDPAVQAGISFDIQSGFYARGFVSEVEINGASVELELAGGYRFQINQDFSLNTEFTYSIFTDEDNGRNSDYAELVAVLDYKKVAQFTLAHTNDSYGTDDAATYVEGRFNLPLHDVIKTAAYVGINTFDGNQEDYTVYGFDAWTHIGAVKFKMSFTDTDIKSVDEADSRIFVTAHYSF